MEELQIIQDHRRRCLGLDHMTVLVASWAGERRVAVIAFKSQKEVLLSEVRKRY